MDTIKDGTIVMLAVLLAILALLSCGSSTERREQILFSAAAPACGRPSPPLRLGPKLNMNPYGRRADTA